MIRKFYDVEVCCGGNPNFEEVEIYNKWFKSKEDLTPANVLNALVEAINYGRLNSDVETNGASQEQPNSKENDGKQNNL